MTAKLLTDAQARALRIVADHPDITGKVFADLMWPDSPGHKKVHRCGNTNTGVVGAPMWRAAGAYLSKLVKRGWLTCSERMAPSYQPHWKITVAGLRLLIEFTAPTSSAARAIRAGAQPGRNTYMKPSHSTVLQAIAKGAYLRVVGGRYVLRYLAEDHQVAPKVIQEMMAVGWLSDGLSMTSAARQRFGAVGR